MTYSAFSSCRRANVTCSTVTWAYTALTRCFNSNACVYLIVLCELLVCMNEWMKLCFTILCKFSVMLSFYAVDRQISMSTHRQWRFRILYTELGEKSHLINAPLNFTFATSIILHYLLALALSPCFSKTSCPKNHPFSSTRVHETMFLDHFPFS